MTEVFEIWLQFGRLRKGQWNDSFVFTNLVFFLNLKKNSVFHDLELGLRWVRTFEPDSRDQGSNLTCVTHANNTRAKKGFERDWWKSQKRPKMFKGLLHIFSSEGKKKKISFLMWPIFTYTLHRNIWFLFFLTLQFRWNCDN